MSSKATPLTPLTDTDDDSAMQRVAAPAAAKKKVKKVAKRGKIVRRVLRKTRSSVATEGSTTTTTTTTTTGASGGAEQSTRSVLEAYEHALEHFEAEEQREEEERDDELGDEEEEAHEEVLVRSSRVPRVSAAAAAALPGAAPRDDAEDADVSGVSSADHTPLSPFRRDDVDHDDDAAAASGAAAAAAVLPPPPPPPPPLPSSSSRGASAGRQGSGSSGSGRSSTGSTPRILDRSTSDNDGLQPQQFLAQPGLPVAAPSAALTQRAAAAAAAAVSSPTSSASGSPPKAAAAAAALLDRSGDESVSAHDLSGATSGSESGTGGTPRRGKRVKVVKRVVRVPRKRAPADAAAAAAASSSAVMPVATTAPEVVHGDGDGDEFDVHTGRGQMLAAAGQPTTQRLVGHGRLTNTLFDADGNDDEEEEGPVSVPSGALSLAEAPVDGDAQEASPRGPSPPVPTPYGGAAYELSPPSPPPATGPGGEAYSPSTITPFGTTAGLDDSLAGDVTSPADVAVGVVADDEFEKPRQQQRIRGAAAGHMTPDATTGSGLSERPTRRSSGYGSTDETPGNPYQTRRAPSAVNVNSAYTVPSETSYGADTMLDRETLLPSAPVVPWRVGTESLLPPPLRNTERRLHSHLSGPAMSGAGAGGVDVHRRHRDSAVAFSAADRGAMGDESSVDDEGQVVHHLEKHYNIYQTRGPTCWDWFLRIFAIFTFLIALLLLAGVIYFYAIRELPGSWQVTGNMSVDDQLRVGSVRTKDDIRTPQMTVQSNGGLAGDYPRNLFPSSSPWQHSRYLWSPMSASSPALPSSSSSSLQSRDVPIAVAADGGVLTTLSETERLTLRANDIPTVYVWRLADDQTLRFVAVQPDAEFPLMKASASVGMEFQAPVALGGGMFMSSQIPGGNSTEPVAVDSSITAEAASRSIIIQSLLADSSNPGHCTAQAGFSATQFNNTDVTCGWSEARDIRWRPSSGFSVVEGSLCLTDSPYVVSNPSLDRSSAPCLTRGSLTRFDEIVRSGNCTASVPCAPCTVPSDVTADIEALKNGLRVLRDRVDEVVVKNDANGQQLRTIDANVTRIDSTVTTWVTNSSNSITQLRTELTELQAERSRWCDELSRSFINAKKLTVNEIHAFNGTAPLYVGTSHLQFQQPDPSITNTLGDISICPASRVLRTCANKIVAESPLTLQSSTGDITLKPGSSQVVIDASTLSLGVGSGVSTVHSAASALTLTSPSASNADIVLSTPGAVTFNDALRVTNSPTGAIVEALSNRRLTLNAPAGVSVPSNNGVVIGTGSSTFAASVIGGTPTLQSQCSMEFTLGGSCGDDLVVKSNMQVRAADGNAAAVQLRQFDAGAATGKSWSMGIVGDKFQLSFDDGAGSGPAARITIARNGDLTTTGMVVQRSSRRYKEHIVPLSSDDMLARISQLQAVTYTMRETGQRQIGLIAEEVAEVFPEVVFHDQDGQVQGVSYVQLIPVLIESVKSLNSQVTEALALLRELQAADAAAVA